MKYRSINHALLRDLRERFGRRRFTVRDAYVVYHPRWRSWRNYNVDDNPYTGPKPTEIDGWGEMSVRNTLCAAVQHGELVRVERGVYKFPSRRS